MTFWEKVGNWFTNIGNRFVSFFTDPTAMEMTNLERIIAVIIFIVIAFFLIKLLGFVMKKAMGIKKGPQIDVSAKMFVVQFVKILLWVMVAFGCVALLGIDVSSVAGVLSAVTVALGLALQDVIGCFAAGLIIIGSRHLKTGDYVLIANGYGQVEGTVIKIGLMITTLLTVNGQHVFVSNNNVIKANSIDYSSYPTRRASFTMPVPVDADIAKVKEIIYGVLNEDSRVLKDPAANVHVDTVEDYCINIAIKFHTMNADYWDVLNNVREPIINKFREAGILIPTRNKITLKDKE
ncbi:MAG: mechanosensitive ion channel family protein [Bacilli bacterium]|nr:mechanosensitive ion channel family protein [Bacilli bacterium]